ncbi:MAG: DUF1460 domain-containing protein [Bacteroidales bacterium]
MDSGARSATVDCTAEDSVILQQVFAVLGGLEDAPMGTLVVEAGRFFLGTPYVAHTLEREQEVLVINLRELDCTTFGETCLAIARTVKSGDQTFGRYAAELEKIRYRDGTMDGYPSRLHYFCDWIGNNAQKGIVADLSGEIAQFPLEAGIHFMSTHPDSYAQLKADSTLVPVIAAQEARLNGFTRYYLPEEELAGLKEQIQSGDILGITTNIDGLAIQHVTIAVWKDDDLHILHASSAAEEVVLSEGTLEDYLAGSKTGTGVMVARPL